MPPGAVGNQDAAAGGSGQTASHPTSRAHGPPCQRGLDDRAPDRCGKRATGRRQPVSAVLYKHRDSHLRSLRGRKKRCTTHAVVCVARVGAVLCGTSLDAICTRGIAPFCWVTLSAPTINSVSLGRDLRGHRTALLVRRGRADS